MRATPCPLDRLPAKAVFQATCVHFQKVVVNSSSLLFLLPSNGHETHSVQRSY